MNSRDESRVSNLPASEFTDARWFPVDLHVPRLEYGFLSIDPEVLERSSFLDTRIDAPLADAVPVDLNWVAKLALPTANTGWLFHTSFCCSTLLARMLHLSPYQTVLKEPLVLRRLSDARYSHWPIDGLVLPTLRLLSRPWDPSGSVVIKPTHAALNIGIELLAETPDSRGVILTSGLDDFLVSNLKKKPETLAKAPVLAERALQMGSFHSRLPPAAFVPPDLLSAAALQWAAQRELCADMLAAAGPQRLRVVDASELLENVTGVAWECAQWLRLPVPEDIFASHAATVSQRNAKAMDAEYDAGRRKAESYMVHADHGPQLAVVRRWFEQVVKPAMRPEALFLAGGK